MQLSWASAAVGADKAPPSQRKGEERKGRREILGVLKPPLEQLEIHTPRQLTELPTLGDSQSRVPLEAKNFYSDSLTAVTHAFCTQSTVIVWPISAVLPSSARVFMAGQPHPG